MFGDGATLVTEATSCRRHGELGSLIICRGRVAPIHSLIFRNETDVFRS
jgi:hypothetical protein